MTSRKNRLKVDRLSSSDWERVLASYPQHGFFSRPEWYKAFEESFPGRYQSHFLHCHNSQVDVFVPCMTEKWKYGLCSLVSSPMSGTSGIFCTASTLSVDDVAVVVSAICRSVGAIQAHVMLTPYQKVSQDPSERRTIPKTTHLLNLSPPLDAILERYSYKVRKNLTTAKRSGLDVRLGEKSDVGEFHKLMRRIFVERFKRPETDVLPLELYQRLLDGDAVDLIVVRESATCKIVSATVSLFSAFEYYQWHNATDYAFSGQRPNELWEDFVIRRAKEKAISFVNMGASPTDGVEKFKESFGAVKAPYTELKFETEWYSSVRKIKRWPLQLFGGA